jgi:hypothetical protein
VTEDGDENEEQAADDETATGSDRLFPESEPIDDPTEVPDPEATEDPMDAFGRQSDDAAASEPVDDDREPDVDGLDGGALFDDVDVRDGERGFDGETDPETDGPLGDLADRMREQRDRPEGDSQDLFEAVDVGEVDEETLWKQVESDEGFVVEESIDREDVVEKSAYCEKCEFFTDPPRVRCTHEGTTIVEMIDFDQFRVRNCPVVLEEEALENIND